MDVLQELFDASLSNEDAIALLKDPGTPADLFARVGSMLLERSRTPSFRPMDGRFSRSDAHRLVLRDARVFGADEAVLLLPEVRRILAKGDAIIMGERGPLLEFAEHAHLDLADLAGLAEHSLNSGIQSVAHCAAFLHRQLCGRDDLSAAEREQLSSLLSSLFLTHPWPQREAESTLLRVAGNVLSRPDRFFSSDLLDWAFGFSRSSSHAIGPLAQHPEAVQGDFKDRFFALQSTWVDQYLSVNPALEQEDIWRLYARHIQEDELGTADVLWRHPELLGLVLNTDHWRTIQGVASCFRRAKQDLPPHVLERVVIALLEHQRSPQEDILMYVYQQGGDSVGARLVNTGFTPYAQAVLKVWQKAPRDGETLRALMRFPHQAVRAELLPQDANSYYIGQLPTEVKQLYREVMLPVLVKDRAKSVRTRATQLMSLLKPRDEDTVSLLAKGTPAHLTHFISSAKSLPEEAFEILLKRGTQENAPELLHSLAKRKDLTLDQYRQIIALSIDEITAAAILSVPATDEGFAYLRSLRGSEFSDTCLARRLDWSLEDRRYFLNHALPVVRQVFARCISHLTIPEIRSLLTDSQALVRSNLVQNSQWPVFAALLLHSLDEAREVAVPH